MAMGAPTIKEIKVDDPEGLMRQYKQTGSVDLRNQLVMHYLQHVNVAIYGMRTILYSNVPFEDFFNQGILALIECIERYDPDRGATFDTYSYMGIRGAILKYLRKQNWLPNRLWEARKKMDQGRSALEQTLLRGPTDEELAEYLNISAQQLSQDLADISMIDAISFEELLGQTYESLPTPTLSGDDGGVGRELHAREMQEALAKAIDTLPPKQKQIIALHYYENLNLREIGEVLDLSQQRVSQLRKKALEQLSAALEGYELYL